MNMKEGNFGSYPGAYREEGASSHAHIYSCSVVWRIPSDEIVVIKP